jgi:hypothetical protein
MLNVEQTTREWRRLDSPFAWAAVREGRIADFFAEADV